jgi:hypothetical protein
MTKSEVIFFVMFLYDIGWREKNEIVYMAFTLLYSIDDSTPPSARVSCPTVV